MVTKKTFFILIACVCPLLLGLYLSAFGPSYWEIRRVKSALSLYFVENNRYPRDLKSLVDANYLKKGSFESTSYIPALDYGTYKVAYEGSFVCSITGPPVSEMTDNEILKRFRNIDLREYYSAHGHYPENLNEIVSENGSEYLLETIKRKLSYYASKDKQSFTLNEKLFGVPSTWPTEMRLLSTEGKVQYIERVIGDFFRFNNRYPQSLQELVDKGELSSSLLRDLTEGERIEYRVSETGGTAYLNGREVKSYYGHS